MKAKNTRVISKDTEDFLKNNSEFYLQITNTGKTAIEEVWIKIPDYMELNVEAEYTQPNYVFKYINYPEPIKPDAKVILFFDDEYFIGENFKLDNSKSNIGEIKYKDYKGKIFSKKSALRISSSKREC